jgi:hypothetical protein
MGNTIAFVLLNKIDATTFCHQAIVRMPCNRITTVFRGTGKDMDSPAMLFLGLFYSRWSPFHQAAIPSGNSASQLPLPVAAPCDVGQRKTLKTTANNNCNQSTAG